MGALVNHHHGRQRRTRTVMSEINVTPMVDVMLVLLIIFMVAAPMLTAGVAVDLPDSAAKPLPGKDEPIIISIQSDGSVFLQETKVDMSTLAAKLEAIAGENTETRVFVRGDRKLNYGTVMEVVGEVDKAGFTKVAFVTEAVQK
jgi:biopolymer transport protein TolR